MSLQQFAKDVQTLLANAAQVPTYEGEAPRDTNGSIKVAPPFMIYTLSMQSPQSEDEEMRVILFTDVWNYDGWQGCYDVAERVDAVLDGTVYAMDSGMLACNRDGLICQREARDPDDARIRRMSGQYLIRFYRL